MKGILNFLARAKLVELSEDEKLVTADRAAEPGPHIADAGPPDGPPDQMRSTPNDVTIPPPAPAAASPEPMAGEDHATPLADIFTAAGVPGSPYPAEKLLRLLDGLRAMDAVTRKAAVLAMDAADDNWQIEDCVSDAEFKIAALDAYKQQLAVQLQAREQQSAEVIQHIKLALDNSTAAIRQQISELEGLLEREVTRAAQETTSVEAGLRAARESSARETRRMDAEIERLREIPTNFKASQVAAH
ncbi:methyl-accepting chemotaxis protein [Accumulibacter sp.]|uniref:methyl-accepting chemotaxis protein n=1 Tax=Accumulibacter sp. TaxID=2053492 RepID=UPI00262C750E|nr:methyl-accepting chemotaxis protein [Accumulibacter sp.]